MSIKLSDSADQHASIASTAIKLYERNYVPALKGCLPSKSHSIVAIYQLLQEVARCKNKIIVFAFDALSFDFFYTYLLPHAPASSKVAPLTSVFPSSTASAWPSILTGTWPAEHGIYGTSFRLEDTGKTYIWISNTLNHADARHVVDRPLTLNVSRRPTLLTKLRRSGWEAFYNGSHGQGAYNPFRAELTKDAVHFAPEDYARLKYQPQALIKCFLERTQAILGKDSTAKRIVWNYYDLDDFIHEQGYDALASAVDWKSFFAAWEQLRADDTAIVLMSDHGQMRQHQCTMNWLNLTLGHPWFEANTGGAGRVLYFYPKAKHFDEAYDWLRKNMGDSALLFTKEEAFKNGLFTQTIESAHNHGRVGDIIAVAQSDMFVSAGSQYVSEHGALTKDEMIVPLMIEGL